MNKEKRTERELVDLIMAEVRKCPECEHVIGAAIIRPVGLNWDAAFTVHGNMVACEQAFEIARGLRARFDAI